jgi:hypothetical protein
LRATPGFRHRNKRKPLFVGMQLTVVRTTRRRVVGNKFGLDRLFMNVNGPEATNQKYLPGLMDILLNWATSA